jgi:hypothetical protein
MLFVVFGARLIGKAGHGALTAAARAILS